MRKLFIGFLITLSYSSMAQSSLLADETVVWAGIDFSEAKLIGSEGFNDPNKIKSHYFDDWNNLILRESDKYNVKKFYRKDRVYNDLSVVEQRNELPEVEELVINSTHTFEAGQLQEIVNNYDLEDHESGLGLVFVVEALNKTAEQGVIHAVFFDISSNEILWSERYSVKPGGFGFRNYWARTFLETLEASAKDYKKVVRKL